MSKIVLGVLTILVLGCSVNAEKSDSKLRCKHTESAAEAFECGAERTLKFFNNLESRQKLQLLPGITLLSSTNVSESGRSLQELKLLPNDPSQRREKLVDLVLDAVSRFASGKTLQLNFDKMSRENLARAIGEGRDKDKKNPPNPWMIGSIGLVLLLVPAALGALGVLATKALVVGKISLVLSLISTLQYFFSGGKNVVPNVYGNKYAGAYGPPTSNGWNGYEPSPGYGRTFQDKNEDSTNGSQK